MGRRRGRSGRVRGGGERRDPATYYATSESDRRYAEEARRRVSRQGRRRWVIRLAILAVLAFVVWMWGGDALRALRVQAHMTGQEFKEVEHHIKSGTEHRSGADLIEEDLR